MTISPTVVQLMSQRIAEHADTHSIKAISVILHGGEPLLIGHSYLTDVVNRLRETLNPLVRLRLSLQTNANQWDPTR